MKRPIILSALILILAFCCCFWWLSPDTKPGPSPTVVSNPKREVIVASSAASRASPSVVLSESKSLLTDTRRRLLDSPDLMKTVREIRLRGTQDEKDWALLIMMACAHVHSKRPAVDGGTVASQAASKLPVTNQEIARERRLAYESVTQRCKGIAALNAEDRTSLQSELMAGSESNSSELARLHSLASTDEDRWSDEQVKLITRSLYSGDPVLQREAFFAAQRSIDRNAPSGADRSEALEQAFQSEVVSGPLSDLEGETACVLISRCPSSLADLQGQSPNNKSVIRLAAEYRDALQAHKDVKSILAIR